jgi:hypothetical protein
MNKVGSYVHVNIRESGPVWIHSSHGGSGRLTADEVDAVIAIPGGVSARARALGVSVRTVDRIVCWGGGRLETHRRIRQRLARLAPTSLATGPDDPKGPSACPCPKTRQGLS